MYKKAVQNLSDSFYHCKYNNKLKLAENTFRYPWDTEIHLVAMFNQTWPSTVKGFDANPKVGGSALTPAYSVILRLPNDHYYVYIDGMYAYTVTSNIGLADLLEDIKNQKIASQSIALDKYHAIIEEKLFKG